MKDELPTWRVLTQFFAWYVLASLGSFVAFGWWLGLF